MMTRPLQPKQMSPTAYVRPILTGLLIVAAGIVPWTMLSNLNARVRPDLPWAAIASLAWLAVLLTWLAGRGPPRRTAEARRRRLRFWPPLPIREAGSAGSLNAWTVCLLLLLLYVAWIFTGRLSPVPDLAAFPTTSYRWSMFIMGGVMSGAVEEAAFRGYMQTGLAKVDPANAVLVMSLVFALSHITQGLAAVLLLGPGLFIAAMLYGRLANLTGSIVPDMVIHILGDLSYTFFGVLRGDVGLLFVN